MPPDSSVLCLAGFHSHTRCSSRQENRLKDDSLGLMSLAGSARYSLCNCAKLLNRTNLSFHIYKMDIAKLMSQDCFESETK